MKVIVILVFKYVSGTGTNTLNQLEIIYATITLSVCVSKYEYYELSAVIVLDFRVPGSCSR